MAQIKRALEFNFLILFNKLKIFFIAMSKFLVFPAQRAEKIPGFLSKASTSRPESSDIQIKPLFLAAKTDLILVHTNKCCLEKLCSPLLPGYFPVVMKGNFHFYSSIH